jgi:hypothetical protein
MHQEINMKETLLALATGAMLAVATLAPTTADARRYGCGVAVGVAGGLAAGAIIGGAIPGAGPAYAYPRAYYPVAGYEPCACGMAPAYSCPGGYWGAPPAPRSVRQCARLEQAAVLLPGLLI